MVSPKPHMVRRSVGGAAIPGGGRDDRTVLAAIGVTGGELLRARRGSATIYSADSTLTAADGSSEVRAARPSACGAAMRPGATLRGTVANASVPAEGVVVNVTWADPGEPAPLTLTTVSDKRGRFAIPCVARRVPLTVTASRGVQRTTPTAIPPLSGNELVIDIDFGPVAARRP